MNENEVNIRGFSWFGLVFIILLSIATCIIAFSSAVNYGAVLANDDNNLPDTRGSITFYLWVNVIVGFFALYIFLLFLYKLFFGNRNVYQDAFKKSLESAYAIGDINKIEQIHQCKDIGLQDEQSCSEFHNRKLKSDKVAYYLENARYVSDTVNTVSDIHETIYETNCELKEKAIECIKDTLEPMSTKELYVTGGVRSDEDIQKAKELSENIIQQNVEEVRNLNFEIEDTKKVINETGGFKYNFTEQNIKDKITELRNPVEANESESVEDKTTREAENKEKADKLQKSYNKYENKTKIKNKKVEELLSWGKPSKLKKSKKQS